MKVFFYHFFICALLSFSVMQAAAPKNQEALGCRDLQDLHDAYVTKRRNHIEEQRIQTCFCLMGLATMCGICYQHNMQEQSAVDRVIVTGSMTAVIVPSCRAFFNEKRARNELYQKRSMAELKEKFALYDEKDRAAFYLNLGHSLDPKFRKQLRATLPHPDRAKME